MKRSILYNEETGWHWHKAWNIPTINVIVDVPSDDLMRVAKFL